MAARARFSRFNDWKAEADGKTQPSVPGTLRSIAPSHMSRISKAPSRASMKDRMANGDWISQSGQKLYQTAYEEKTKLKPGDIINFVYHTADPCKNATSANLDTDGNGRSTWIGEMGMVYSKRRFGVVMAMHDYEFEILPNFTCGGQGIRHKRDKEIPGYMCLKRDDDTHPVQNERGYASIAPKPNKRTPTKWSYAHLLGTVKVNYHEDWKITDRLTPQGYDKLVSEWLSVIIGEISSIRKGFRLPHSPAFAAFDESQQAKKATFIAALPPATKAWSLAPQTPSTVRAPSGISAISRRGVS